MKAVLAGCALWLALVMTSEAAAPDGLFWESGVYTDPSVTTTDGTTVHLGRPFAEKVNEAVLMSMSNDNSKYEFVLFQSEDYDDNSPALVLVWQGHGFVITNRGGGKGETERDTQFSDPAEVEALAAYFKITPHKRVDPQCKLTASFVIRDSGYAPTEPVLVDFKVTNAGSQTVVLDTPLTIETRNQNLTFEGTQHFASGDPVPVAAVQQSESSGVAVASPGKPAKYTVVTGPSGMVLVSNDPERNISGTLAPGQTISATVNLRDFLVLDKPGTYSIRGKCAVVEVPPNVEDSVKGFVRQDVQWNDSVTAQTEITVNSPGH